MMRNGGGCGRVLAATIFPSSYIIAAAYLADCAAN